MQRTATIFAFILIFATFVGCGKSELSRTDARKLIESKMSQDVKVITRVVTTGESYFNPTHFSAPPGGFNVDNINEGENKRFRESGYVNVEVTGQEVTSGIRWTTYITTPTDKLRPYIVSTRDFTDNGNKKASHSVRIGGDISNIVVTGLIKESQGQVGAEFTYDVIFNDVGQKLFLMPTVKQKRGEGQFTLFDDGWRLTSLSTGQAEF